MLVSCKFAAKNIESLAGKGAMNAYYTGNIFLQNSCIFTRNLLHILHPFFHIKIFAFFTSLGY